MATETDRRPLWEIYPPSSLYKEFEPGKLLARVFLPYSRTLTWANPNKMPNQLDVAYFTADPIPNFFDGNPLTLDEENKPMPGNITDELYWAVRNHLPFDRLLQIRQLALLKAPHSMQGDFVEAGTIPLYPQSRRTHSFLTAKIAEHIGIEPIPALVHDLATVPFGDATKSIDPEGLSEETNLEKLLDRYDLTPLAKFGFDRERTLQTVKGLGTEGLVLDIADKIAYTARDVFSFIITEPENDSDESQLSFEEYRLRSLVQANPYWTDVYRDVKLKGDGTPYFENPTRLGNFLEIRAFMHQILYLNPEFRRWEMIYTTAIGNLYSREPNPDFPYNSDNLLLFTDHEILHGIKDYWQSLGANGYSDTFFIWKTPVNFKSSQQKTAQDLVREQYRQGNYVISTETIGTFNTGSHFLTVDPADQTIKPYSLVRPEHSTALDKISRSASGNTVYFLKPGYKASIPEVEIAIRLAIERSKGRNNGTVPHYSLYQHNSSSI